MAGPTSAAPAFDGHLSLVGVFGGNPDVVPAGYAHQAVNRFFREDFNRARPVIRQVPITFESEEDRIWFEGANGQGAFFYNRYPSNLNPELIASVGGKIFAITPLGRTASARVIFDGNTRTFMHSWFAQGFEWLFIQDGINPPIFYNGITARRSDIAAREMPIGSVMAYIHGRMVVASADGRNTIQVGDIVYGSNTTNTNDLLLFTEQQYWAEGGSFSIAANLGNINGLYAMPFLDTGTAQNELVAMCDNGFTSFDFSGPRPTWIDNQVQKISLIGQGLASSHGFAGLNGDVFFRRTDGIGSYRNARGEYAQTWRQTPISRAVDYWIKDDRSDLLQFTSMVSWQNMIFCGCSPLITPPNNPCFGYHYYNRGFVVFDAQSESTASRDGTPVWHGMWTGIRPWAMISGSINTADRCFMFSYDRDGKNRLYEVTLEDGDDLYGTTPRKKYSRYDTSSLGAVEGRTSFFQPKLFAGGMLEMSNIKTAVSFTVSYRPDGSVCYLPVDSGDPGCDCPTIGECSPNSQPAFARKWLQSVNSSSCVPGTSQSGNSFYHCQVRVEMEGSMQIDRLNIQMELQEPKRVAECMVNNCQQINCCPSANDYTYHIAPVGTNAEVPDLSCGPAPPPVFQSTRYWTQCCQDDSTNCATGFGQATSTESQAAADAAALAAAQANAQAQLDCVVCVTQVLLSFEASVGTYDLSSYFVDGAWPSNIGMPYRLRDVLVGQNIAIGYVDPSGTLVTNATFPEYTSGTFNPTTHIFEDFGPGTTVIQLQLGCNKGGQQTFPLDPSYGSP